MINEVSAKPLHPLSFLPEWQQNIEVGPGRISSPDSLIKSTQPTASGKRKRRKILLNRIKQTGFLSPNSKKLLGTK